MNPFLVLMGLGTLFSGVSGFFGQSAQNMALEYNALMAEHNARLSNLRAEEVEKEGKRQELLHRIKTNQLRGSQKAAAAASGVMVGEGSPADVLQDTAIMGEMDAMTIQYNTAMEAWAQRTQGTMYGIEAQMARSQKVNPLFTAGSNLLGGMGNLTAAYMYGKKKGG